MSRQTSLLRFLQQRSDRDGDERDVATTSSAQALQNPEGTDEAGNQRETRPDEGEVDRPCRGSAETEGEGGGHVLSAADNTPGPSTASRAPSMSSSGSSESDSESESDSTEESSAKRPGVCDKGKKRKKKKKKIYLFQDSWFVDKTTKQRRTWLKQKNRKLMWCEACRKYNKSGKKNAFITGTTSMRLKVIESHEKSPGHVSAMNRFDMERVPIQERPMEKVVQKMEEKKLQQMINLFRTAFYVAKQGRPYTDFPELLRLQKCNGLDVGTAYWNDKEARIFVDYISLGMKKELRSSLQESDFVAVLADGSSDAGNIEEEVIQIRYLKDNIEPTTAFVALKSLERGDAVNITDAVKSALKEDLEMGEEWKNKLAFACFDGAAVNVGHLSGVGMRLQEECPHLIVLHCCAHRLELVVKDVLKEVPYFAAVQDLFTTIYKFYHNSALNWQGLRNAGEALDILVLKPVRASGTRWLPHQERALKAVMRDFPALVQHLGHLVEHGEVGSKDSREKANGILQGVKSIKFVLFLLFLSQYLQLMSSLSKVFQDNSSTLETVYRRVENVVKTLNKLSRPEKLSRIFSEGMEERDGVVLWKGIPLQAGRPQRGRPGGLASQREEVMKDCQQIINATSHHLGRRFDVLLSHRVFSAARRVFQFSTWPQDDDDDPDDDFGDDDIRTIYQHFQHPVELKGVDLESCLREWSELKEVCRNQLSQARRAPSFSEFWMRFMRREEADSDYRNIFTLLRLSLVIPIHTAQCERSFSLMNRIKTDWRARLESNSLTSLMTISLSPQSLDTFDPLPAVTLWWEGGRRRPNTTPYGPRRCQNRDVSSSESEEEQ
ncbi:zinc finger protein 862-like [Branchiostoma floridae x Branchiostoma belcheri]